MSYPTDHCNHSSDQIEVWVIKVNYDYNPWRSFFLAATLRLLKVLMRPAEMFQSRYIALKGLDYIVEKNACLS